ncbi:MAG TPA: efflux RND transporter permease subunit [Quisquiliibacterium sp.]|nr:efflux RND transporter permease subunit [Quisquiliibacterium sp.]
MFKWILDASLRNRVLVLAMAAVLLAGGAWQAGRTPVDVFPDLNKPTVNLMTEAGGMAPEEVEQLISYPLETAMNGLPGVEVVRSVSAAGLSIVYVTFGWDTDVYRARQFVTERLSSLESALPQGVVPKMGPMSSIMGEVMLVALPIDEAKTTPMAVREYADWVLRPRLLAVPGVAQVIPIGGEVRQFQVQPDTRRMAELRVGLEDIRRALSAFASNTSGGFLALAGREYLIRNVGRTASLEDLAGVAVATGGASGQPILLSQVADVRFAPAIRRGDAGLDGRPAVILSVQKQPAADTVRVTRAIESALAGIARSLPAGIDAPRVTFRQADFIEASIGNLQAKLAAAAAVVAVVVFAFLGSARMTLISLTAIPLSILAAILVFRALDISINTMTLGGIAIAIGELVDDAIVDLENIVRRLRENATRDLPRPALAVIRDASQEVRGAVIWSTVVIALVFVPLFALPGIEGRLFVPLGVAYVAAILASLVVAVTVTPVLAWFLIGRRVERIAHREPWLARALKARYRPLLEAALDRPAVPLAVAIVGFMGALLLLPTFPRTFLPPFNEGSAVVGLRLNPGVTLEQSTRVGREAERALAAVPEVTHVARRSGRAELDEHAEGVHVSELEVGLQRSARPLDAVYADMRAVLAPLPLAVSIGQPISHRLDHLLSGVRAQIAIRIVGDDLDTLRGQAAALRERLAGIRGLADLEIEKQVLAPQIRVRVDHAAAARHGVSSSQLLTELQSMVEGVRVTQVVEGSRRFDLVLRLPEGARGLQGLADVLVETPHGRVPLGRLAAIEEGDGPNQISRDDGRRRIVISANAQGRALSEIVADVRSVIDATRLPEGYFVTLGGQFQAQEEASRLIGGLAAVSAILVFLVLHSRYRSGVLALLVMANVPLALVGSVIGLWISGQPLSVAALVGFVTLAGIATRNGVLKIGHWVNLMRFEGAAFDRTMIVRGSMERLVPVLMTALTAALALSPLLFEAEQPGTEILHPVAVVIFSGLVSSTLLDAFVTPVLFARFGAKPARRLRELEHAEAL